MQMGEVNESKLWRPYDNKHTLLGTYIPNCLAKSIIEGKYKYLEIRAMFFICRMSFGFQRDETNVLNLEDFANETNMSKSSLSKAISALLKQNIVLSSPKKGNTCKYAINLLPYGVKMKHYKIINFNDINDKEDHIICTADYEIYNLDKTKKFVIVYSSKGYSKSKTSYIKSDINTDIKIDKTDSFTVVNKKKKEQDLIDSYDKEISKNNTSETLLKYLIIEQDNDLIDANIALRYYEKFVCKKDSRGNYLYDSNKKRLLNEENDKLYDKAVKEFYAFYEKTSK